MAKIGEISSLEERFLGEISSLEISRCSPRCGQDRVKKAFLVKISSIEISR